MNIPETSLEGREDIHTIILNTDWPDMVGDDGRAFEAAAIEITFGEEPPIPGDQVPHYSCTVVVVPDTWSDGSPEWEGKRPECRYSNHTAGPHDGAAPVWVVEVVKRHRPEWYPKDPALIPRTERPLKAV